MIDLYARLFGRPERHYIIDKPNNWFVAQCACGYSSAWDADLHRHFAETGRIGK